LAVFIFYILSRIIDKFFLVLLILAVDKHFDLALFRPDHHRLIAHAAHHVKRIHRPAPQGQLKGIFLHSFFKGTLELMLNLKKSVGRT
jgi:hypothetical protein